MKNQCAAGREAQVRSVVCYHQTKTSEDSSPAHDRRALFMDSPA